jgi:hypothetical protein
MAGLERLGRFSGGRHRWEGRQRRHFEAFRKVYPLPTGVIVQGDKPDVILKGTRVIGMEITNFYVEHGSLPGSEQRQRELREKVVSNAELLYQQDNQRNIRLKFWV